MVREIRAGERRPSGEVKRYNVTVVFDPYYGSVLLELKHKGPYPGQYNFPGGKLNEDEDPKAGAERELKEETNLGPENVWPLRWLATYTFPEGPKDLIVLDVYYTRLKSFSDDELIPNVTDVGDPLTWRPIDSMSNANDSTLAGQGNLPYLVRFARESLIQELFVQKS